MESHINHDIRLSRLTATIGKKAQQTLANLKILLVGLDSLGVETLRILALLGPKSITCHDMNLLRFEDYPVNIFAKINDIGKKTRVEATIHEIKKINPYVEIKSSQISIVSEELIEKHDIVIFTNYLEEDNLIKFNEFCRNRPNPIGFISAVSIGFYVNMFIDFGDHFEIIDGYQQEHEKAIITNISNSYPAIITFALNQKTYNTAHTVRLKDIKGMETLNDKEAKIIDIKYSENGLHEVALDLDTSLCGQFDKSSYAIFEFAKSKMIRKFSSLKQVLYAENFQSYIISDFDNTMINTIDMHLVYKALLKYVKLHGSLFNTPEALTNLKQIFNEIIKQSQEYKVDLNHSQKIELFLRSIVKYAELRFPILCTFLASMITNETMKISGKFRPQMKFFHYEITDLAPLSQNDITEIGKVKREEDDMSILASKFLNEAKLASITTNENNVMNNFYSSIINALGTPVFEKLSSLKVFIVGAGALGCEYLRLLSSLGFGTGKNGAIYVADFDTISLSNLIRQFLFNEKDIGKSKSLVAVEKMKEIMSNFHQKINIIPFNCEVSVKSENIFTDDFWNDIDIILMSVDNIKCREYLFNKGVQYQKWIFDAGTSGPGCSHDPYICFYSSKYQPILNTDDKSAPTCTVREFPYTTEHCMQYAREIFDDEFICKTKDMLVLIDCLDTPDIPSDIKLETIQRLYTLIIFKDREDLCILQSIRLFERLFHSDIKSLLKAHPPNKKTLEGADFWALPKRIPNPLQCNPEIDSHMNFIVAASNIYSYIYGLNSSFSKTRIKQRLAKIMLIDELNNNYEYLNLKKEEMLGYLKNVKLPQIRVKEFEKDDDKYQHIDFILHLTNLRCEIYHIPGSDKERTRLFVGKIIPSTIVSTSFIVSLSTIEIIKYIQNKPFENFRGSMNNLAIPSLNLYTIPKVSKFKIDSKSLSFWDIISITSPTTLGEIINHIQSTYGIIVDAILYNSETWYRNPIDIPSEFRFMLYDENCPKTPEQIINDDLYLKRKKYIFLKVINDQIPNFPEIKYIL